MRKGTLTRGLHHRIQPRSGLAHFAGAPSKLRIYNNFTTIAMTPTLVASHKYARDHEMTRHVEVCKHAHVQHILILILPLCFLMLQLFGCCLCFWYYWCSCYCCRAFIAMNGKPRFIWKFERLISVPCSRVWFGLMWFYIDGDIDIEIDIELQVEVDDLILVCLLLLRLMLTSPDKLRSNC